MIYGLYLSAAGLISNSYRQDVLANNLANSETTGFKRNLAFFKERPTALQERNRAGDWSDPTLEQIGGTLLSYTGADALHAGAGTVRSEFLEHANVDPTNELTELMDTQRQLEANANMIRYQDQTLQRLVNDVGKIS